jgi:hypothetical protein
MPLGASHHKCTATEFFVADVKRDHGDIAELLDVHVLGIQ